MDTPANPTYFYRPWNRGSRRDKATAVPTHMIIREVTAR